VLTLFLVPYFIEPFNFRDGEPALTAEDKEVTLCTVMVTTASIVGIKPRVNSSTNSII
jgi:hypothetical protein